MRELKLKGTTWISVVRPRERDVQELHKRFPKIHSLVLEDIDSPTIRSSHVESFDDHLYVVLHFPNFIEEAKKTIAREIDFILMNDTLITVQYDLLPIVENFWNECEMEREMGDRYGKTPVHLLYYILREFFSVSLKELDQLQERIDDMEEEVFSGSVKRLVEEISLLRRNVLDFRRAVKPQNLTLESLSVQGIQLYGEKARPFFTDLVSEYLKVWNLLENHKEALDAVYDTNNALLASRTNHIMRIFTILTFINFIPTTIANIYSMNIKNIPFSSHPYAFLVIVFLMITTSTLAYLLLKWRKLIQ